MALWSKGAKPSPDPIFERLARVQAEVQIAELEQQLATLAPVEELAESSVATPARGLTQASPFVEAAHVETSRSLLPWRRNVIEAKAHIPDPPTTRAVKRAGFVNGIPTTGTTASNSGTSNTPGSPDRDTEMTELLQAYLSCPWASTCVDGIARTITAGGLTLAPISTDPDDPEEPVAPPECERVQALLDYVNPYEDIRQLMRRVYTDMLIFGDSFTEVSWMLGEPVALWPLDCQTMAVISDDHGNVTGYVQQTDSGRKVEFAPEQIIHVRMDSPGAGLYGVSPTSKAVIPIKTWLFAAGLVKETMKKGDPPRVHVDWPLTTAGPELKRSSMEYATRNLGVRNIGNLFETRGNAQVKELSANKIDYWLAVMAEARDEILSAYGVPKRKAGVSESGSLGGAGAEVGEDKTFRVNTCGPTEELALEKFTFALCYQAFGIKDWRIKFAEVDWRDELVVEQIRDLRLRNGSWTLDRYRDDIGEPSTEGGADAVLVDRQNLVLWSDMKDLSAATVAGKGKTPDPFAAGGGNAPAADPTDGGAKPTESITESVSLHLESLSDRWRREYSERRRIALREIDGLLD